MEEFIKVKNVYFQYEGTEEETAVFALNGVEMCIAKGEFVAVVGHNGSGKSTLAKHFNSLYLPTTGDVWVDGMNTKDDDRLFEIRKKVGLVLQNPDNQIVAGIVEEDVAFGCENLGVPPKEIRQRVDEALKAVDMYDYRKHSPDKLSGGQKQRVAIAGIIAMEPECIVLDEPTAMLDPQGREEVIATVQKLNRERGITIIMITHYMEEAVLADRVIVMDSGKVLTEGTPREVFAEVEMLKRHRLDVPQATELIYQLRGCGYELPKCVLNEEECAAKRYMMEDLGDTNDFDFNDVVVDVSSVCQKKITWRENDNHEMEKVSEEEISGTRHQEAIVRAAGGIYDFTLTIGTTTPWRKREHLNASSMLNTGWDNTTIDYNKKLATIDVTGWIPDDNNISLTVYLPESVQSTNKVYTITFPKKGTAPKMIAVETTQNWMTEKNGVPSSWWYE